jgi:hypothetical protein
MSRNSILAARAIAAHERALEVIGKYGDEETKERLANTSAGAGGTGLRNPARDPVHALALHGELIGALAGIVDELSSAQAKGARKTK